MLPNKLDIEKYVQRKERRIGSKYRMGIEVSHEEINQCRLQGILEHFGITKRQYEWIMSITVEHTKRHSIKRQSAKSVLSSRIRSFLRRGSSPQHFTYQDVMLKFGEHPKCPLTGRVIEYSNPKTFVFDHVIPVARGGEATLANLQLLAPAVNSAKWKWLDREFIEICRKMGDQCPNADLVFREVFTHRG